MRCVQAACQSLCKTKEKRRNALRCTRNFYLAEWKVKQVEKSICSMYPCVCVFSFLPPLSVYYFLLTFSSHFTIHSRETSKMARERLQGDASLVQLFEEDPSNGSSSQIAASRLLLPLIYIILTVTYSPLLHKLLPSPKQLTASVSRSPFSC